MSGELEGLISASQGEHPIISACQIILTIFNPKVGSKTLVMWLELSISMLVTRCLPLIFTMFPVRCAVSTRSVSLMIPAKTVCPDDWTLEYIGYLMADNNVHTSRMTYECVDIDPQSIPGLEANGRSSPVAYFQIVEAVCGGLACTPYNAEAELTCVVCTR